MEDIAAQGEKVAFTSLPSETSPLGSRGPLEEFGATAAAEADPLDPEGDVLPKIGEAKDPGDEDAPMAPSGKAERADDDQAAEDAALKTTRKDTEDDARAQRVLQPSLQQTMADVEAIHKLASAAKRKTDGKGGASAVTEATTSAPESAGSASSASGGRQRP